MCEAYSSPHHGSKLSWGIWELPPPNRKSIPLAVLCWDLFSSWSTLLVWSRVPWVQGKTWVDFCSGLWRLTGTRERDRKTLWFLCRIEMSVLSGRDVPYVTAWTLPSPSQPALHSSRSSLTLTIEFIPIYHHIHLQKSAKCQKSRKRKNTNSKERKEIDASVSKVNLPISKSTLLDFVLRKKLQPSAQICT